MFYLLTHSNVFIVGRVRNEDRLDNQFYRVLLDGNEVDEDFALEFQQNRGTAFPDQFLWRRGNRNDFMLNVDIALARDLEGFIDPTTGFVTCSLNGSCPDSPLLSIAMEYASNNRVWVQDFRDAFIKMTSSGCEGVCTDISSVAASLETGTAQVSNTAFTIPEPTTISIEAAATVSSSASAYRWDACLCLALFVASLAF